MESNFGKSLSKKVMLKKTVISVLNEEELAMVSGGVKAESAQALTTSFFSCTGSLCCTGNRTEPPTDS